MLINFNVLLKVLIAMNRAIQNYGSKMLTELYMRVMLGFLAHLKAQVNCCHSAPSVVRPSSS